MDVEKCFDKLWLQACINALFKAGIDHDHLNLLYSENKQAQIAVKINDKLSARIKVSDLVMQGSVWGSIKCTNLMDKLKKKMQCLINHSNITTNKTQTSRLAYKAWLMTP